MIKTKKKNRIIFSENPFRVFAISDQPGTLLTVLFHLRWYNKVFVFIFNNNHRIDLFVHVESFVQTYSTVDPILILICGS